MGKYLVTWEIDAETDSPVEAAKEAFNIMQRPGTEAVVFEVKDETSGERYRVDLLEDKPEATKIIH